MTGIQPVGAVEYAGLNGNPTQTGNFNTNKWGPRGGIAYQLDSKTVIRGGYGLFWAPQFALGGPISTLGYSAITSFTGSTNLAGALTPTLYNPFPGGFIPPDREQLRASRAELVRTFRCLDPNAKSPRVQQYSIDIQRQLPYGIAAEVGYVGSYSTHMTLGRSADQYQCAEPELAFPGHRRTQRSGAESILSGTSRTAPWRRPPCRPYYLQLPFSAYGKINEMFSDQNRANYNSMVVKAQKRLEPRTDVPEHHDLVKEPG